jgi:hypothetical protein
LNLLLNPFWFLEKYQKRSVILVQISIQELLVSRHDFTLSRLFQRRQPYRIFHN